MSLFLGMVQTMKHLLAPTLLAAILSLWLTASAWAHFYEGLAAYNRGDYATAFEEWLTVAEHGEAGAQYNLGFMYDHGQGVPQDYAEAVRWYRLAAEQGTYMALGQRLLCASKIFLNIERA